MGIVRPLMQASLLLAVMLFSACTGGKDPEPPMPSKTYTLTVRADKGSDAETRALSIDDGGKMIGEWATTDHVYVKKGNTWCTGYIQPQYAGTSTTLSGTISGVEIAVKDQLLLQFPRQTIDYTGQDGTLQTIAESYDYSSATATVTSVDGGQVSADAVTFSNQQAIVKFNLRTTSGTAIQASSLKIAAAGLKTSDGATGELTITPASPTAEIYAALSGISNATITLTATVGSETYRYERAGVTFANGIYYPLTVKMKSHEEQQLGQPLTLEPTEDDTQITFINNAEGPVEFSRNLTNWVQIGSGESCNITVDAGQQVYFRGNNATYYPDSEPSLISCTAPCYVYGNVMSLVSATGYETLATLTEPNTFRRLFEDNANIISHPQKSLLLPATTLQPSCYRNMFSGCTSLTVAPTLPATALRANCYQAMFEGCSALARVKCLATNLSPTDCTTNWLSNVSATGVFIKNAAMTSWPKGDSGIPYDWQVE